MDKKLISFSVDEMNNTPSLEEINESQFMKIRIRVFSDGVTRHGYGFSLDTVKESAFTLLGKPILYKYDIWTDDCASHEKDEVQCGFIPKDELDANITFEYDEDLKKTFVCVSAYIWKVYQEKLVKILERDDGYKNVSCEMWLIEADEEKKKEIGYIPVDKFCFNGLTLLGDTIVEACEGADMQVVKFSIVEYEKAKDVFIQQLHNSIKPESQEDSFLIQQNNDVNKEATMEKQLDNSAVETPDVLDNAQKCTTVNVSVSEYTDTYDDNGKFIEATSEYHSKSETKVEEVDDASTTTTTEMSVQENQIENACNKNSSEENASETESSEENAAELKCATLENDLSILRKEFKALELKCATLEEYKTNKESAEKTIELECAINEVSNVLSVEEIAQWREKSLNCSTVDGFKNELKAFAFDKQKNAGVTPVETLRNSIPTIVANEPTNIWDRLAQNV